VVLKELLKLDLKKTFGSDGFSAHIVNKLISDLFNRSFLSGEVPIAWKAAMVHPVFKRGD
jgi:hypothetical protein